jgi:hypothetical protein
MSCRRLGMGYEMQKTPHTGVHGSAQGLRHPILRCARQTLTLYFSHCCHGLLTVIARLSWKCIRFVISSRWPRKRISRAQREVQSDAAFAVARRQADAIADHYHNQPQRANSCKLGGRLAHVPNRLPPQAAFALPAADLDKGRRPAS